LGFAAAATLSWVADVDTQYVGATIAVTANGTNLLITTDAGLTRAAFITPAVSQISYDVVDYLETQSTSPPNYRGDRRVFLPQGARVYFIASTAMSAIIWLEDLPPVS
jgi:hypothetical protein